MNRCAIPRDDGTVRIGILCDTCSQIALQKLLTVQRSFWVRDYQGPRDCEGCNAADMPSMEENDG